MYQGTDKKESREFRYSGNTENIDYYYSPVKSCPESLGEKSLQGLRNMSIYMCPSQMVNCHFLDTDNPVSSGFQEHIYNPPPLNSTSLIRYPASDRLILHSLQLAQDQINS